MAFLGQEDFLQGALLTLSVISQSFQTCDNRLNESLHLAQ